MCRGYHPLTCCATLSSLDSLWTALPCSSMPFDFDEIKKNYCKHLLTSCDTVGEEMITFTTELKLLVNNYGLSSSLKQRTLRNLIASKFSDRFSLEPICPIVVNKLLPKHWQACIERMNGQVIASCINIQNQNYLKLY